MPNRLKKDVPNQQFKIIGILLCMAWETNFYVWFIMKIHEGLKRKFCQIFFPNH